MATARRGLKEAPHNSTTISSSSTGSSDSHAPTQGSSTAAAMAANVNAAALEIWSGGNYTNIATGSSSSSSSGGSSGNASASGDSAATKPYDPAANDGMPCWLALARQSAPPPYDAARLTQPDQGSQRLLSKLQQSAIT
jgi:hypothetical protein